ncbi:MAG: ATP-grasp domain-containing protein [Pseudomonadota bacterium]
MKHIMFIEASQTGAGLKAVEYAKSRGYFVTLLTRSRASYSDFLLKFMDKILVCDTNSNQELLTQINLYDQHKKIDGITTTADCYVPQASLAANILGLPGMPYSAALKGRNKYLMRCALNRVFPALNPKFALVNNYEDSFLFAKENGFPFIAKPQDQNDSSNVKKIFDKNDLLKYMENTREWDKNSFDQILSKNVLLEAYIPGEEYSVETIQAKNADIKLMGITKKDSFLGEDIGHFTELGASFPFKTPETKKIFDKISQALKLLEINCCVAHTECRIDDKGELKLLEINPRLAGDMLGSHVIELATGEDAAGKLVEVALGNSISWEPKRNKGAALIGISCYQAGIFIGIENLQEVLMMPGVEYINIWTKMGTLIKPALFSNSDLIGRIVTQGKNAEEAKKLAKKAFGICKIKMVQHKSEIPSDSEQFGIFTRENFKIQSIPEPVNSFENSSPSRIFKL